MTARVTQRLRIRDPGLLLRPGSERCRLLKLAASRTAPFPFADRLADGIRCRDRIAPFHPFERSDFGAARFPAVMHPSDELNRFIVRADGDM